MSNINEFMAEFLASHGGVDMAQFCEDYGDVTTEGIAEALMEKLIEAFSEEENQEKLKALLPKRATKTDGEKKIKDPNKPTRGKSAYLYFCAEHREQAKEEILEEAEGEKVTVGVVTKKLAAWWDELKTDSSRKDEYDGFVAQANEDKERYKTQMEDYTEPTQEELKATVGEKKKRSPAKKKDSSAPKKPKSAYIFFCSEWRETVRQELEEANEEVPSSPEVTSELGVRWQDLKNSTNRKDLAIRKKYEEMAAEDKARYEGEKEKSDDETAVKKPAVKKPVVKKPVVKKPEVVESDEEEPAVKKPAVKKPVAKKPEVVESDEEEPAVKKPAVKKPVAKKPEVASVTKVSKPKGAESKGEVKAPVKKKMGAFAYFTKETRQEVMDEDPDRTPAAVTRELGLRWKALNADERAEWEAAAAE